MEMLLLQSYHIDIASFNFNKDFKSEKLLARTELIFFNQ